MSIIHDPALHQLRHRLRGYVYDPGEPEYDEACTLFNARIERRPRHVVRCSRPHHVAALDAKVLESPVQQLAGGADKRPALQVLLVARLLADEHELRLQGALTTDRLRGAGADRTLAAMVGEVAQGGQ